MTFSRLALASTIGVFATSAVSVADVAISPLPSADGEGDEWKGVSAARVSGEALAVWSSRHAWLSRDDGHNFAEVLPGAGAITAAVVSAEGDLFVARGEQIGVERTDGTSDWRLGPCAERRVGCSAAGEPSLMFAGRDVVGWIDSNPEKPRLFLTFDRGRTWRAHTLPELRWGTIEAAFADDDGTLQLGVAVPCGDICGCDHTERHVGHVARGAWRSAPWPHHPDDGDPYYSTWDLGPHGWAYVGDYGPDPDGMTLVAFTPAGKRIALGPLAESESLHVAGNGRLTFAQSGKVLYRLDDAHATLVDRAGPGNLKQLAVDEAGRALELSPDQLVRWSRGKGWQVLFDRPRR